MKIKECYISHNGISCFTNINSLVNIEDIKIKSIKNNKIFNVNTFLFYIGLTCYEIIIKDFIKNKFYLLECNSEDNLLPCIMFS